MCQSRKAAVKMNFDNVFYVKKNGIINHLKNSGLKEASTQQRSSKYVNYIKTHPHHTQEYSHPNEYSGEYLESDNVSVSKEDAKRHVAKLNNTLMYIYTDISPDEVILCGVLKVGEGDSND